MELGIPYSDPLADGPVIQAAAGRALAAGTTCAGVLDMLERLREQLHLPVVLFTYANPLLNMGVASFCDRAAAASAAGLVVPDLPLEEALRLSPTVAAAGLDMVLLVAPTTSPQRMAQIAQASRGFIYLVSVTGVTGNPGADGSAGVSLDWPAQIPGPTTRCRGLWHLHPRPGAAGAALGQ